MAGRKETGNVRLLKVEGESRECIEAAVREHVVPGSLIFTDSHKAYDWLPLAGFVGQP